MRDNQFSIFNQYKSGGAPLRPTHCGSSDQPYKKPSSETSLEIFDQDALCQRSGGEQGGHPIWRGCHRGDRPLLPHLPPHRPGLQGQVHLAPQDGQEGQEHERKDLRLPGASWWLAVLCLSFLCVSCFQSIEQIQWWRCGKTI